MTIWYDNFGVLDAFDHPCAFCGAATRRIDVDLGEPLHEGCVGLYGTLLGLSEWAADHPEGPAEPA